MISYINHSQNFIVCHLLAYFSNLNEVIILN